MKCKRTLLSFALMLINGSLTVLAFSGVLWQISPLLMTVAVLYAGLGSYCTIRLGRPQLRLNFDQLDKEADFRSGLIYLKENTDAVAQSRREIPLTRRLLGRLAELAENQRIIIGVNQNVGFFTTFYSQLADPDYSGLVRGPAVHRWRGGIRRHHLVGDGVYRLVGALITKPRDPKYTEAVT